MDGSSLLEKFTVCFENGDLKFSWLALIVFSFGLKVECDAMSSALTRRGTRLLSVGLFPRDVYNKKYDIGESLYIIPRSKGPLVSPRVHSMDGGGQLRHRPQIDDDETEDLDSVSGVYM